MATIKSYTDLEQSKKLAEILPLESADAFYPWRELMKDYDSIYVPEKMLMSDIEEDDILAWSLAALLEQLPYELCDDDGNSTYLQMNKDDNLYQLVYTEPYNNFESIETDRYEHFVDACYEMILKLKELNLL